MYQSFDAFEYVEYLRRRWRVVGVACAVAIMIALPVSLLLPKKYTATASIMIDPPGSSDARTAIVVSPMYLESLKTYERFAASDSLFTRAVDKFQLQEPGQPRPIESLKRSILKVAKLRDTKILEISVTLKDPQRAQSMAEYLAEETARVSQQESRQSDQESIDEAAKLATEAQHRLEEARKAWSAFSSGAQVDALQNELDAAISLQNKLQQQQVEAEASIAEYRQQKDQSETFAREQLQAAQARAGVLEKKLGELRQSIQKLSAAVASRSARRDEIQNEMNVAETVAQETQKHAREVREAAGTRGERLRVIDPGIVPQRPSSPNVPLNVAAAIFVALVASVVYLSFAFVFRRRSIGFEPAVTHGMRA